MICFKLDRGPIPGRGFLRGNLPAIRPIRVPVATLIPSKGIRVRPPRRAERIRFACKDLKPLSPRPIPLLQNKVKDQSKSKNNNIRFIHESIFTILINVTTRAAANDEVCTSTQDCPTPPFWYFSCAMCPRIRLIA